MKKVLSWYWSSIWYRLLIVFGVIVIALGLFVYFIFVQEYLDSFKADISTLGKIELLGVSDIELRGDNQIIFTNNSRIGFLNGFVDIYDVTGKGPTIGYDFEANKPVLQFKDGENLTIPFGGNSSWNGSIDDYLIQIKGDKSHYSLVLEKNPGESSVWEWRWIFNTEDDTFERVIIGTNIYTFLRRPFITLDASFTYGSVLGISDNSSSSNLSPLRVYGSSICLIVTDFDSIKIYKSNLNNQSTLEKTFKPSDNSSATFLVRITEQDGPAELNLHPLPPDSKGYYSSLRLGASYSVPFWPVYFPTVSGELSVSIERCWSLAAEITASTGEFRVGSDHYMLNPLDTLEVKSDVQSGMRGNLPLKGIQSEWNKRSFEVVSTLPTGSELYSSQASVKLNLTSLAKGNRWAQLAAEWKGAIPGALGAFLLSNIKMIISFFKRILIGKREDDSVSKLIKQALLKLGWDKKKEDYTVENIKIITLAREASEIGCQTITTEQAEKVCKNLKLRIVLIQGERYIKVENKQFRRLARSSLE